MNFSQIRPVIKTLAVLTLIMVPALAWSAEEKATGDKVAVVNGVTISKDTYERELDFFVRRAAQGGQQIPDVQMAQMKNEVLESLIERELLFQESKKKGIKVKIPKGIRKGQKLRLSGKGGPRCADPTAERDPGGRTARIGKRGDHPGLLGLYRARRGRACPRCGGGRDAWSRSDA